MGHRILIVEDEPLIAMMIEDFLVELGHQHVGTADTVAEALAYVGSGVDAAILDVNLRGGEKSWPIADALSDAGRPFLFASGGDEGVIPERHRGRPILVKPFTMEAIARALDHLQAA
ncbi:response regulator [Sphingomonas sp. GlSt437]|uniref:response regulator n=1 Tax=Sphingomonas sp. GlSt437 TaxID=3389970 RepID=UPI003A848EF5